MNTKLIYFVHGTTYDNANKNDWRKTGDWQPGWEYNIDKVI